MKRAKNKRIDPTIFTEEDINSFWGSVDKSNNGCWEWTRSRTYVGYGQAYIPDDSRPYGAHRVAYALATGQPIENEVVRHTCHNKSCVRPDHLASGTSADNAADSVEAGLLSYTPPKLSYELAEEIRSERLRGESIYSLAERYDVSTTTISHVINHQIWA